MNSPANRFEQIEKPATDTILSRAFSDLIVGAATVAAGGCLAWEKETKPGGVVPLQFVRRVLRPVEHLYRFGAKAAIHVVIKVVEIHHRSIQDQRKLRHIGVIDDQI